MNLNALELADKLQHASSQYGAPFGDLWDGGAMLRNLHTENTALRATEYALRDRVKELEQANEAFAKRQEWWNNRMVELEQQLAARVPDGWNPSDKPMTAQRALYFMERFKHEEKLLGPNEQAAVDFVIAMLAAAPQP